MPEKAKNKTNLQHRVSLRITLQKIIILQSDTKALQIMFPAAKNDWAKNAKNKPKTKQTCYSTYHYILPIHKLCLYKTTTKHQSYVPGYSNRLSKIMPEKAKNKNKVVTVRFNRYYSFKNYTFTKRHQSTKNYVPRC